MSSVVTDPPFQVELKRATKFYGDFTAIRDVDLGVRAGEFFSILGPSGGGKTTVLRAIAGLIDLTSGDLLVAGKPVKDVPVHKRGMGIVFQNYALFPHMTVAENIAFGLKMRGIGRAETEERVTAAMARVHLQGLGDRRPSQLSGGQQQRVALARAIVINPTVILLDEPLGALDRNLRIAMQAELKALQRDLAITTLCVTHDQEEALSLSDRIAVMSKGTIAQIGTPVEIYETPASRFVAGFVGGTNLIDGTVQGREGDLPVVRLAGGDLIRTGPADGLTPGIGVTLSLRYESVRLDAEPCTDPGRNAVSGIVTATAYAGAGSLIHVRVNEWLTLVALSPGPPGHHAGDSVHLSWSVEATRALIG